MYFPEARLKNLPFGKQEDYDDFQAYAKDMAEGIYANFRNNKTAWGYTDREWFLEMKKYSEGDQDYTRYIPKLTHPKNKSSELERDDAEASRKGWKNIAWKDIISPANKIVNLLLTKLETVDFYVNIEMIDEGSVEEKKKHKALLRLKSKEKDFLNYIHSLAGMPPMENVPEGEQDIEIRMKDYKVPFEGVLENIINNHTFKKSNWKEEIREARRDMINYNKSMFDIKLCEKTGTAKVCRIDPSDGVVQYSKHNDHRDINYGGYFYYVNISDLIERGILSKDDSATAHSTNTTANADKFLEDYRNTSIDTADGQVTVFRVYWKDIEYTSQIIRGEGDKKTIYEEKEKTKKISTDKKEVMVLSNEVIYQADYIIGTNIIYDAKPLDYQVVIDGQKVIPLIAYKDNQKSITEQLKPYYDNIVIAWYQYQDSIATFQKAGIGINADMLKDLKLGGKLQSEDDLINRFRDTGIYIYKEGKSYLHQRSNSSSRPIIPIPSQSMNDIMQWLNVIISNSKLIEEMVGINPIMVGSQPDKDVSVAGTKIAVQSAMSVMQTAVSATTRMKEQIAEYVANFIVIKAQVEDNQYKGYYRIIGKEIDVLKENRDTLFVCNFISIANEQEKQFLLSVIQESYKSYVSGRAGINEADMLELMNLVNQEKSYEEISAIIRMRIEQSEKKKRKEQLSIIEANTQSAVTSATKAEEAKIMADNFATENKIKIMGFEYMLKSELDKSAENRKIINILAENFINRQSAAQQPIAQNIQ